MKVLSLFGLLIIGSVLCSSCKKEYSCNCTTPDGFFDITYLAELKKKEAKSWCDGWTESGATIEGWNCSLK